MKLPKIISRLSLGLASAIALLSPIDAGAEQAIQGMDSVETIEKNIETISNENKSIDQKTGTAETRVEKVIEEVPVGIAGNFVETTSDTSVKTTLDYRLSLGKATITDEYGTTDRSVNRNEIGASVFVNSWWKELYVKGEFNYLNITPIEEKFESASPNTNLQRPARTLLSDKLQSHFGAGAGFRIAGDYLRVDAELLASIWDSEFQGGFKLSVNGDSKYADWDISCLSFGPVQQFRGEVDANIYALLTAHAFLKNTMGEWEAGFGPGISFEHEYISGRISPMYSFQKNRFGLGHYFTLLVSFNIPGHEYQETKKVVRYIQKDPDSGLAARQEADSAIANAQKSLSSSYEDMLVSIAYIQGVACIATDCRLKKRAARVLEKAGQIAKEKGYTLVVTSAYRTEEKQEELYKDDSRLVCGPEFDSCPHVNGIAVDLYVSELVDKVESWGHRVPRKTAMYDPSNEMHSTLKSIMNDAGFNGILSEWWHFQIDPNASDIQVAEKEEKIKEQKR